RRLPRSRLVARRHEDRLRRHETVPREHLHRERGREQARSAHSRGLLHPLLSWGTHPAFGCTAAEKALRIKALAAYKRQMAAARRAYSRTHHSAKAGAEFVKRQRAKLKALQQRVAACG